MVHSVFHAQYNESTKYMLPLLHLLSSSTQIAGKMISVVGRDFHLWNVFFLVFFVSTDAFTLSPFFMCLLCSFFIHFIQIFDLLHYYLFVKNDEKETTESDTDTDILAEKVLTVN